MTNFTSEQFDSLAKALEKAKVPSKLVHSEFEGKETLEIHLGWKYPDRVGDKAFEAAESVGLRYDQITVCAESHGSKTLRSKTILGGPKRY